jgi:hypothetical protein
MAVRTNGSQRKGLSGRGLAKPGAITGVMEMAGGLKEDDLAQKREEAKKAA